jgi:glutathione S-transferase
MILIGQYDSPFVRRVAVALTLYGFEYVQHPWSVFGDADKIAAYNPLRRAPTLVLDDGEVLIDSWAILDGLDGLAGDERALFPQDAAARRAVMKIAALASGAADKGVSLLYELRLHQRGTPAWIERCQGQVADVLNVLEKDRAARSTPYWFGETIGHADIMVACALRFLGEAHQDLIDMTRIPALAAHSERCEALPAFRANYAPYTYTPPKDA